MLRAILGDKFIRIFAGIAFFAVAFSVTGIVFAVRDCNDKQTFEQRCAVACYPNTVYDTKYNRCTCNASVTIREVK